MSTEQTTQTEQQTTQTTQTGQTTEQTTQTMQKPVKPTVSRVFHRNEQGGGLRRRVTVKYEYNRETQTLKYGASIWKSPLKSKEKFVSQEHLKTVEKRFEEHPVVIENFADDAKLYDFHQKIRKQLFTHGCRSKVVASA